MISEADGDIKRFKQGILTRGGAGGAVVVEDGEGRIQLETQVRKDGEKYR